MLYFLTMAAERDESTGVNTKQPQSSLQLVLDPSIIKADDSLLVRGMNCQIPMSRVIVSYLLWKIWRSRAFPAASGDYELRPGNV